MSSILKIILGLLDDWDAWHVHSDDEESTVPRQDPRHSYSIDTLKHCFEQVFHPLDDTGNRLSQLRCLWRSCYALIKSDFFADVFHKGFGNSYHAGFLYRVYRRISCLYSYRKGIDVLLHTGIPYLISITQGCHPHPPDMTFVRIPRDPPSTIQMDATPDQFIFQVGQRQKWKGDLARDSPVTSQARLLWSVNETKTINVHPLVSLCNFLYSSGTRVIQDRIGTSKQACNLCQLYSLCLCASWHPRIATSDKFRVDWAIPQTLSQTFARDDAERIIADVTEQVEQLACCSLVPVYGTISDCSSQDVPDEQSVDGWSNKISEPW